MTTEKELGKYSLSQETFVDKFIEETFSGTDAVLAANIAKAAAGYTEDYPVSRILSTVRDEIIKRCQDQLVMSVPKAIQEVHGVLVEPTKEGSRRILEAATLLMDRGGVIKREHVELEVKSADGIVILPAKIKDNK